MKNRNLIHSDDWATPKAFYDALNAEFHFDHDPCPLRGRGGGLKATGGNATTSTHRIHGNLKKRSSKKL